MPPAPSPAAARSTAPTPKPPAPKQAPARPQASRLPVSRPGDSSEREAEQLAARVAAAADPARVALLPARPGGKKALAGGGGTALPASLGRTMGATLGADLSGVRIHADAAATARAAALGARAFTVGGDIYFGAGQYRPESAEGRQLLAHELVHTVQQRAVVQRSLLPGTVAVTETVPVMAQRAIGNPFAAAANWVADTAGDALAAVASRARAFFASRAQGLGGYRLFTMAIGHDPIADTPVNASGADVLRAIVGLVPFGDKIVTALDNHGIFDQGAAFLARQFGALKAMVSAIAGNVRRFITGLGLDALGRLGSLWDEAKALVVGSISEVINFLGGFASDFAALVKDAVLKPLGAWAAANVPHWKLLTGVLGKNPVSEEGDSPAQALIGAFMKLIGQQEVWENIQKGGAIGRAWAWFQTAMSGARALVTSIPGRVKSIFTGLTISDLLTIVQVFGKIVTEFGKFVADFMGWAGGTVLDLLEIILSVVAPGAVPYLKKAGGAFKTIIANPIGFIGNLVAAGKQGFQQFAGNFLTHLKAALIGWLTGSLAGSGVYIPQGFNLREILKFVASVLGLTWAQLRLRLVNAVGETAVKGMEAGFALVKTLVTEGPAAAWQQIVDAVGNLKSMAIDAVMDYVKSKIVTAAVTKLLSMLSPAGAFIQALIAIYNTIMFFVERLSQIAQVAASFIDSIAAIANGSLGAAAARVERTMAGLLVLVISFLARIAGLGKVSDAINNLIKKIRAPIEKALDKVIAWVVAQARKLGKFVAQAGVPNDPNQRLKLAARDAVAISRALRGRIDRDTIGRGLGVVRVRYGLTSLDVLEKGGRWSARISINPILIADLPVQSRGPLLGPDGKPASQYAPVPTGERRPISGPNLTPMLGKLRQVFDMFAMWASLGTAPKAPQMLSQIRSTMKEAERLHEDQQKGVAALEPRFQALAASLRSIQSLDPKYQLFSIGNMEITLKGGKGQMAAFTLNYNMPEAMTPALPDYAELVGQVKAELQNQQDGTNSMLISHWLQRQPAAGVVFVRPAGEDKMRKTYGRRSKLKGTGMAAPHNPDQVLSGEIDPTGRPVREDINSSLGSQNKDRSKELKAHLLATYPGPEQTVLQLNVRLVLK